MIRPIAISTAGYLCGVARDVLGIGTDGYLTRRILPVTPGNYTGGGSAGPRDLFLDKLLRDDEDILTIIRAISGDLL